MQGVQTVEFGQPETQRLCLSDELHPGHVGLAILAVAARTRHHTEQTARLVQADGLGRRARAVGNFSDAHGVCSFQDGLICYQKNSL